MPVAVRVIPCLDVDAGRVVKGVNFADLRDAGDPVEMARVYDAEGADELTFLDVTASSGERATMLDVVRRTAEQVFIPLTVGGGIRSGDDIDVLLRAGAAYSLSGNTAALARLRARWGGRLDTARAPDALRVALAGEAEIPAVADLDAFPGWVEGMKRRLRALVREILPEAGIKGADHVLIGRADGVQFRLRHLGPVCALRALHARHGAGVADHVRGQRIQGRECDGHLHPVRAAG